MSCTRVVGYIYTRPGGLSELIPPLLNELGLDCLLTIVLNLLLDRYLRRVYSINPSWLVSSSSLAFQRLLRVTLISRDLSLKTLGVRELLGLCSLLLYLAFSPWILPEDPRLSTWDHELANRCFPPVRLWLRSGVSWIIIGL
jgi:hypothetical protein